MSGSRLGQLGQVKSNRPVGAYRHKSEHCCARGHSLVINEACVRNPDEARERLIASGRGGCGRLSAGPCAVVHTLQGIANMIRLMQNRIRLMQTGIGLSEAALTMSSRCPLGRIA